MASGQRRITRTRELLACTECRKRKLKCDRDSPCSSCVKRNDDASCTYERFTRSTAHERERRVQAEARLEHLEGLVQQLAASQSSASGPPSDPSSARTGGIETNARETASLPYDELAYTGSTHWSAMLEDIEELRNVMGPAEANTADCVSDVNDEDGTTFLFGAATSLPFEQILDQYLPLRQEADRLVSAYFRAGSMVAPFVHAGHFRKRYRQFWASPQDAPPLWTSLLFTICHIATITLTPRKEGNVGVPYSMAAAQCLAIGRYYKPQQYAVEALLLFAQSKAFQVLDISRDMGMIMASVIRLATSSGYHRDPSIFNMSPFQQEMRRRTWSLCIQLDLLMSFHLGLPSNIQTPTWNVQIPRNLKDSDFDEDMVELPPGRPDSEATTILFYIAKHSKSRCRVVHASLAQSMRELSLTYLVRR